MGILRVQDSNGLLKRIDQGDDGLSSRTRSHRFEALIADLA